MEGDYRKDFLLELLREMLLIRRFEEKAGQMYGMGLIGGFCHLYIGQEAVVVGMQAAIGAKDAVITSDHGCVPEPSRRTSLSRKSSPSKNDFTRSFSSRPCEFVSPGDEKMPLTP